jgi:hypothetical protein
MAPEKADKFHGHGKLILGNYLATRPAPFPDSYGTPRSTMRRDIFKMIKTGRAELFNETNIKCFFLVSWWQIISQLDSKILLLIAVTLC